MLMLMEWNGIETDNENEMIEKNTLSHTQAHTTQFHERGIKVNEREQNIIFKLLMFNVFSGTENIKFHA